VACYFTSCYDLSSSQSCRDSIVPWSSTSNAPVLSVTAIWELWSPCRRSMDGCNGSQLHLSRSLLSMVCGHRMNALVKLISLILFVGAGCFLLFGGLLGFLGLIPAILALAVMVTAIFMSRSVSGKMCPQCAGKVKTEAVVCRYCGHKFTSPVQLPRILSNRNPLANPSRRRRSP
jgi:ribosomal protein L40E